MNQKILITVICLSAMFNCMSQTQGRALRDALGQNFRNFEMYSYPSTNFGIGTACRSKWDPFGGMLCDMIKCYGLENVHPNSPQWKTVNGFAFYGDGAPITFNETSLKVIGIGMLLPKLLHALNINLGFNYSSTKSISVSIDSGEIRTLVFDKFRTYVQSLSKETAMRRAYDDKKLVIVTADFVALNYNLEITPADSLGIALNLKIDSALKINPKFTLLGNDSLGVTFKKSSHSSYVITSTTPLILGVVVRKQKKLLETMTTGDFSEWSTIAEDEFIDPTSTKKGN